jgi:hypothetical protein
MKYSSHPGRSCFFVLRGVMVKEHEAFPVL